MSAKLMKWVVGVSLCAFGLSGHAQTITYSYDALGRLILVSHETDDDRLYEYDDANNITEITVIEDGNVSNTPPVCGDWTQIVSAGTSTTTINPIAGHCSDADGDTLTLTATTQPANSATANLSGNYIVFTNLPPNATTSVTFTVSDGNGGSDSAVLNVYRLGGGGCTFC